MIKCEITSEVIELAPERTTQVSLKVINQSQLIDYFSISLVPNYSPTSGSINPAWVTFSTSTFSLRPMQTGRGGVEGDSQQTVEITVSLPPGIPAGSYSGKVVVAARTGPENSAEIPLNLVVSEVELQTLDLQPPIQASRRGTELFRITLTNQGNAPHLYSLYAEDNEDACRYEIIPPEVMLGQGAEANLTLKVRPRRRNWAGPEQSYPFILRMEGFPQEAAGQFTQKCALPPVYWLARSWQRLVAAAIIVAALLTVALVFILPMFIKTATATECGPEYRRQVNLISNDVESQIWVSGPHGNDPMVKVVAEKAEVLPGLFYSLISVSPDGRRLAYITARNEALDDAKIYIVDIETRQSRLVAGVPASGLWPTAPIWSADGEKLIFVSRQATKAAAVATAAASPAPGSPTPTTPPADNKNVDPTNLELWIVPKVSEAPEAKMLAGTDKLGDMLETTSFYGQQRRVVCWTPDNSKLLIWPKPTGNPSDNTVTRIDLEGKVDSAVATAPNSNGTTAATTKVASKIGEKLFVPARTGTTPCDIAEPYSQNDPRWADRPLRDGNSKPGDPRIADFGCPVTAAAMLLNYYSISYFPDQLLSKCLPGALASPWQQGGWDAVQSCSSNKLTRGGRIEFSWDELNRSLAKGPAIVGLLGGQTGTHFVIVNSGADNIANNYHVTDPFDGSTYKTLGYFLDRGYRLGVLIAFQGVGGPCGIAPDTNGLKINFSGVQDGGLYQDVSAFKYDVSGFSASPEISLTAKIVGPNGDISALDKSKLPMGQAIPLSQEGYYFISVDAKSRDGEATRSIQFIIDKSKPRLSRDIQAAADKNGKFTRAVPIQLHAVDSLSGVASIFYQIDQGELKVYSSDTNSAPFLVTDPGVHTVIYGARDAAGNEASDSFTLEIVPPAPAAGTTTPVAGVPTIAPANGANGANGNGNANGQQSGAGAVKTTVRAPVVTTIAPVTTPPVTTIAPVITTPPITTPPVTTPPVTVPGNPVLLVTKTQLTFQTGATSQITELKNNGKASLSWKVSGGTNASLLSFSQTEGQIDPGASIPLNVSLVAPNLPTTDVPANFGISSNGGNASVAVNIKGDPIPTAVFLTPSGSSVSLGNSPKVTITLTIKPAGARPADHASLVATYVDCPSCPAKNVPFSDQPNKTNNWTIVWDTTDIPPQTGISLNGKLCVSTDDSVCSDIPPLTNLFIPMAAQFVSPVGPVAPATFTQLLTSTPVTVSVSGRVDHVSFTANYLNKDYPLPDQARSPGWAVTWDTSTVTPNTPVTLKGKVCWSFDDTVCYDMTPVTGLSTVMTGTVAFSPALSNNSIISATTPITISVPTHSANIDHVSLYATYSGSPAGGALQPLFINATSTWRAIWTPGLTIPAQPNIRLDVKACFTADETTCTTTLATLIGIQITPGLPFSITTVEGTPQSALVSTMPTTAPLVSYSNQFGVKFKTVVKDQFGNPVKNVTVNYSVPDDRYFYCQTSFIIGGVTYTYIYFTFSTPPTCNAGDTGPFPYDYYFKPGGKFGASSGSTYTSSAVTDINGEAVPSNNFFANSYYGSYTVSSNFSTTGPTANFTLNNTNTLAPVVTIANSSSPQTTKVLTAFKPLVVQVKDPVTNKGVSGINVTFDAPTGSVASGTFSNATTSITATTDANGFASVNFTANSIASASSYNVKASYGGSQVFFSLTNTPGDPATITPLNPTQSATVGTQFTSQLQAEVRDASNNLINVSIPVTFTVRASGVISGSFTSFNSGVYVATPSTAPSTATAPIIFAGSKAGTFTVEATFAGATTPAVFTLTNLADVPAQANSSCTYGASNTPCSSGTLTATVGGSFPDVTITLHDQYDNPVRDGTGVNVTGFPGSGASASVTNAPVTTTGGVATVRMSANSTAGGPYSVTAAASAGTATFNLSLQNLAGAADPAQSTCTYNAGSTPCSAGLSQTVGGNFPTITVTLRDSSGNAVANNTSITLNGLVVDNTVPAATAGVTTAPSAASLKTTGNNGQITIDLTANTKAGTHSATIQVVGVTGTFFTLNFTNTPGAAVQVNSTCTFGATNTSCTGNTIATAAGTNFPNITITLHDQYNNPVANGVGINVTGFPASGASASVSGSPATAGGNGQATVQLTANGIASATTYNATAAAAVGTASFTLTLRNNPGAAVQLNSSCTGCIANTAVNTAFPVITITLHDANNNPVANGTAVTVSGLNVDASANPTNPGVTSSPTGLTTTNGVVTINLTANLRSGNHTGTVTSGAVSFTLTLTNNPDAAVQANSSCTGCTASTAVNTAFPAITVTLRDTYNNLVANNTSVAISGLNVDASANPPNPGVTANPGSQSTVNGVATFSLTANRKAGVQAGPITITSGAVSFPVSLTNNPGAAANISCTACTANTTVNTAFAAITVNVTDSFGNPVANGTAVTVSGLNVNPANPGVTSSPTGLTTTGGSVTINLTANQRAGTYTGTITSGTGTATLNLTNTPGAAAQANSSCTGCTASATVNTAFPAITITLRDTFNNTVANGTAVTISGLNVDGSANPPNPGVTANPGSPTTTAGVATINLTANRRAGVQAGPITATSGAVSFTLTLTNNPGAAVQANSTCTYNAGATNCTAGTINGTVSTAFPTFTVTLQDAFNNPVPNVTVTITVTNAANGAGATPATQTTAVSSATGTVTFTLTANASANNPGNPTYTATATANAGSATFTLTLANA